MNKGVLIGGGLGLLALAFLAGVWFNTQSTEPLAASGQGQAPRAQAAKLPGESNGANGTNAASASGLPTPSINGANEAGSTAAAQAPSSEPAPWAVPLAEAGKQSDKKPLTREERRAIRRKVQAKMAELLAKGQSVTAEDTQAFINDVESLGQGVFDPRYFATMRDIVGYSAQTQALSKELGAIAYSKTTKDVARQQEILAEIRVISTRISNGTATLQSYARDAAADKSAK